MSMKKSANIKKIETSQLDLIPFSSILLLELFFISSGNSGVLIPRLRFATIAAACKAITIVIKYTKKLGRYKILKDITT